MTTATGDTTHPKPMAVKEKQDPANYCQDQQNHVSPKGNSLRICSQRRKAQKEPGPIQMDPVLKKPRLLCQLHGKSIGVIHMVVCIIGTEKLSIANGRDHLWHKTHIDCGCSFSSKLDRDDHQNHVSSHNPSEKITHTCIYIYSYMYI